jgi:hypothetical protein
VVGLGGEGGPRETMSFFSQTASWMSTGLSGNQSVTNEFPDLPLLLLLRLFSSLRSPASSVTVCKDTTPEDFGSTRKPCRTIPGTYALRRHPPPIVVADPESLRFASLLVSRRPNTTSYSNPATNHSRNPLPTSTASRNSTPASLLPLGSETVALVFGGSCTWR